MADSCNCELLVTSRPIMCTDPRSTGGALLDLPRTMKSKSSAFRQRPVSSAVVKNSAWYDPFLPVRSKSSVACRSRKISRARIPGVVETERKQNCRMGGFREGIFASAIVNATSGLPKVWEARKKPRRPERPTMPSDLSIRNSASDEAPSVIDKSLSLVSQVRCQSSSCSRISFIA